MSASTVAERPQQREPTIEEYGRMTPREVRQVMREGRFTLRTTRNVALGHVQCALVVLPKSLAFEFMLFCQRNQRPCPVLDVTDPGDPEPRRIAPGADLRTDSPGYSVYRNGVLEGTAPTSSTCGRTIRSPSASAPTLPATWRCAGPACRRSATAGS